MIRKIIKIDKDKCNGCGLCVNACHEGAIGLVEGKAELLRDDYCDGLGNCLPVCPTGAITFEEREALSYNEEKVKEHKEDITPIKMACGCPGTNIKSFMREKPELKKVNELMESELIQWPVQIKLTPVNAPFFKGANLLIAADCTAYAYANFHKDFIRNHITLIGCPKLDEIDYSEKLSAIIKNNDIKSIKVVRMEVPCCGGLSNAVITALRNSAKMIPWQIVTISTKGEILD